MIRKMWSFPGVVAHYAVGSAVLVGSLIVHGARLQQRDPAAR